jgi:hypothetical protein
MWAAQASPSRVPEWAVWAHKASLTPPLFIEVPILIKKSERSCIWVLRVLTLSTILLLDFVVFFEFCFSYYVNIFNDCSDSFTSLTENTNNIKFLVSFAVLVLSNTYICE